MIPYTCYKKKGLQLLYHGKFHPKRKVHTLKEKVTLTGYKKLDLDYKVY